MSCRHLLHITGERAIDFGIVKQKNPPPCILRYNIIKATLVIEVAQEVTSDVTANRNVVFGPLESTEEMGNFTFCCMVAGITPVTNFSFFYIHLLLQDSL